MEPESSYKNSLESTFVFVGGLLRSCHLKLEEFTTTINKAKIPEKLPKRIPTTLVLTQNPSDSTAHALLPPVPVGVSAILFGNNL